MSQALVVLSGGQDSVTCLFWAIQRYGADNVSAVTFAYGQRHEIEIEAARRVAQLAGVLDRHEIVQLGPVLAGTSPLTNRNEQLEQYPDFDTMSQVIGDRIEKTFVPMRNAMFLTLAANRAEVAGAQYIITGVCQQDGANYPDCRESFILSMEDAINEALGKTAQNMVRIETPLMDLSKAESVELAVSLPGAMTALSFSHTAYDGQYPPKGHDHATLLRAQGFAEAMVPDPLVLRAVAERLMDFPETSNYETTNVAAFVTHIRDEAMEMESHGIVMPAGQWWL